MSSLPNEEDAPPMAEAAQASKPEKHNTAALLPSAFPREGAMGSGAEGYEGERLHEMFLSTQPMHLQVEAELDDSTVETGDPDQNTAIEPEPPINFEPFFTVIENTSTGAQYHPHVHYIFSDDDPDLLTNAMLNALDPSSRTFDDDPDETETNSASVNSKQRCIIVDIDQNGESIVSARSLSPNWQVLGHSITTAPTFGEDSKRQEVGLMLRIEGQEGLSVHDEDDISGDIPHDKETTNDELLESLNLLASRFHGELDNLRKLTLADPNPNLLAGDADRT